MRRRDDVRSALLALGEAKWQETIDISHIERLEHIRDLLISRGQPGAESARLLLFSGAGFSDQAIQRAHSDSAIDLVGLEQLYAES